jgi:hypothetical protein
MKELLAESSYGDMFLDKTEGRGSREGVEQGLGRRRGRFAAQFAQHPERRTFSGGPIMRRTP